MPDARHDAAADFLGELVGHAGILTGISGYVIHQDLHDSGLWQDDESYDTSFQRFLRAPADALLQLFQRDSGFHMTKDSPARKSPFKNYLPLPRKTLRVHAARSGRGHHVFRQVAGGSKGRFPRRTLDNYSVVKPLYRTGLNIPSVLALRIVLASKEPTELPAAFHEHTSAFGAFLLLRN